MPCPPPPPSSSPPPAPGPDADPVGGLYRILGESTLRELVAAFYRRVRADDLIGPMYPPQDWAAAERRLADFLIQRFGGPTAYSDRRGHPRLRMRHAPFPITPDAAQRWLELMHQSQREVGIPEDVGELLGLFFRQVALHMINRPPEAAG